jgi:hypothetical protein
VTYALVAVIVVGSIFAILHYCISNAPQIIVSDDEDRIQLLRCKAKALRDQLDAMTREFIDLHDATTDDEVDELTDCILHDVDYDEVLERIRNKRIK